MTDSLPYVHLKKHNAAFLRENIMLSAAGLVRGMLLFQNGMDRDREMLLASCWLGRSDSSSRLIRPRSRLEQALRMEIFS